MVKVNELNGTEVADYVSMFPTERADPIDAAEALVEKFPSFSERGFFEIDAFLRVFSDRCRNIIIQLPLDHTTKDIQIDLAYMLKSMNEKHKIIMAKDILSAQIRAIEEELEQRGVLSMYHAFSDGKNRIIDTYDIEDAALYLKYLFFRARYGIRQTIEYLQMCIDITQYIPDGVLALREHMHDVISNIQFESIEPMLDTYDYLGVGKGDKYEQLRSQLVQENPGIPGARVRNTIEMDRQYFAGFHLFMLGFLEDYIQPYAHMITSEEKKTIRDLLADLCDILDPGMRVPISIYTPSEFIDFTMRSSMFEHGKLIH